MRFLVLLLLVPALAGCVQGDGGDPGFGCPAWSESRNSFRTQLMWDHGHALPPENPKEDRLGHGLEQNRSRPLDRFQVEVSRLAVADGVLEVQAFGDATGRPLVFQDARAGVNGTLRFEAGEHTGTWWVDLRSPDDAPAPEALRLVWDFTPDGPGADGPGGAYVEYRVTLLYLSSACL